MFFFRMRISFIYLVSSVFEAPNLFEWSKNRRRFRRCIEFQNARDP